MALSEINSVLALTMDTFVGMALGKMANWYQMFGQLAPTNSRIAHEQRKRSSPVHLQSTII